MSAIFAPFCHHHPFLPCSVTTMAIENGLSSSVFCTASRTHSSPSCSPAMVPVVFFLFFARYCDCRCNAKFGKKCTRPTHKEKKNAKEMVWRLLWWGWLLWT
jgi:hypothetical protein